MCQPSLAQKPQLWLAWDLGWAKAATHGLAWPRLQLLVCRVVAGGIGHCRDISTHQKWRYWHCLASSEWVTHQSSVLASRQKDQGGTVLSPHTDTLNVRKTLKLKFLFYFIYFHPVEPKCDSKCSQSDHGNNNSHACNYSIVYMPVCVHPHSMIKYCTIYVT